MCGYDAMTKHIRYTERNRRTHSNTHSDTMLAYTRKGAREKTTSRGMYNTYVLYNVLQARAKSTTSRASTKKSPFKQTTTNEPARKVKRTRTGKTSNVEMQRRARTRLARFVFGAQLADQAVETANREQHCQHSNTSRSHRWGVCAYAAHYWPYDSYMYMIIWFIWTQTNMTWIILSIV